MNKFKMAALLAALCLVAAGATAISSRATDMVQRRPTSERANHMGKVICPAVAAVPGGSTAETALPQ